MKQRNKVAAPAPAHTLALAARTLAHEVRTPLNALAIHLELLRKTHMAETNMNTVPLLRLIQAYGT